MDMAMVVIIMIEVVAACGRSRAVCRSASSAIKT
jgi:hypothetical protein